MRKYNLYILFCIISLVYQSCRQKHNNVPLPSIDIDFSKITEVLIDTTNIVFLETCDNSLLYDICLVEKIDDCYFIYSRNVIRAFDADGHYLFNLSGKGNGPNEYLSINNFWKRNGMLYIYDRQSKKIMSFNSKGKNIGLQKVMQEPNKPSANKLFPLADGSYLSTNTHGGSSRLTPTFSHWNKDLNQQETLEGRFTLSGFSLPDICFNDLPNERILYWEGMKDTLFAIRDNKVAPLYAINFGKYAIPTQITQKDFYDQTVFLNKNKSKKYAYWPRYYQVKEDNLFFTFGWGAETYLCRYNEKTRESHIYRFVSPKGTFNQRFFCKIMGDTIVLELESNKDIIQNHALFLYPLEHLK